MHGGGRSGPVPATAYRTDIQGLRAVAVLLVVFNHVGLSFVRGGYVGVDVFFVVSGFLITGLLLRSNAATGHIDLLDFYSRRARRILPAAALTLVATDIAAWALLNYVRAQTTIQDSIWAAFFAANIQFERIGTDYFASGLPPSPILHFWSLAVEEQFYLVWPFLLALLLFGQQWSSYFRSREHEESDEADETPAQAGGGVLVALLVIVALSLAWCVWQTQIDQPIAYFSPFARAWELGVGAALAVASPYVAKVPRPLKASISWVGLVGILVASGWFTDSTRFPGSAALLPVLSTALVIAGGIGPSARFGARALLGLTPLRFVGDASYSFYLWHWPFLIIGAAYATGPLSLAMKLTLVAAAFATSVVTYLLFENPIRRSRRLWGRRPSRSGGLALWPASIVAVLVVSTFGLNALRQVQADHAALSTSTPPLSQLTIPEQVAASVEAAQRNEPLPRMFPSVDSLRTDYFDLPDCIVASGPITQGKICYEGDLSAPRSLVVFGDSHAANWLPALIPIAKDAHWKLIPLIKDACVAGTWGSGVCSVWYRWAFDQVREQNPAAVIIGSCRNSCQLPTWGSDMRAAIRSFKAIGAHVIVLGDSPGQDRDSLECLLAPGATMRTCTFPLAAWKISLNTDSAETVKSEGAEYLDVQTWFCAKQMCPDVIRVVIAYRDTNHLTKTYVAELTQTLSAALSLNG